MHGLQSGRGGEPGTLKIERAADAIAAEEPIEPAAVEPAGPAESLERREPVSTPAPLPLRRIAGTWWPLAASWFLMGIEQPTVAALLARFPDPAVNLAAYGGIIFPLSLVIESPIIMLLAASTALSKDWRSYVKLRRFMMWAGAALTVVHLLVTFTPLYHIIVRGIIGVPEAIVEPGRIGMMIMTPWSWAIAYRRFQQGVLIRFGRTRAVGAGTVVRLTSNAAVLVAGYWLTELPGIVVGTAAVSTGVLCEAAFAALCVRPVLRDELRRAPAVAEAITPRSFLHFYVPLALTSLFGLLALPLNSMALSRMPLALESLAVWPVIGGLTFIIRAVGIAYNEVVVALIDEPRSVRSLRRFAMLLAGTASIAMLVVAATPLSAFWFARLTALPAELAALADRAFWIAIVLPALSVCQSWFQGIIVQGRRTRGIPEAVAIALVTMASILVYGIVSARVIGLYVGLTASVTGQVAQVLWLRRRSRPALREAEARELAELAAAERRISGAVLQT